MRLLLLLATLAGIPAEIISNRVVIPASVNGNAPALFILDTGAATTTLEKEYAGAIGIRATKRTRAVGAAGSVDVGVAMDVGFDVGGRRIAAPRTPLIPLEAINRRAGRPVQGVLGHEVFNAYVVEMDYAGRAVTLHDPKAFQAPRGAVTVPLHFSHRTPSANVQLTLSGGRTVMARLLLDTGASQSITLTRAFAKKHAVEVEGAVEMPGGLGVGGGTTAHAGRIPRAAFAGFTFERPVITVSHTTSGILGSDRIDGILGGEILRRFTLFVDYRRKQMLLEPNDALRDPFEIDMTGALLEARDATFTSVVVFSVLDGSPAAAAGIRAGDELRAIDGRAVSASQLDEIRKMFKQPGRTYELTLVRNGAERTVPITTRRLV